MKKVKITSLGCAKNLVDSEVMAGLLQQSGFIMTDRDEEADVIIINSCGFISDAKEESIEEILQAAAYKKSSGLKSLIVAGCLAQRYSGEILKDIPEVDGIIGTGEIPRIVEVVSSSLEGSKPSHVNISEFIYSHEMPRILFTPKHSAYIKIAEGCNNRCAYCAIPSIRGEYRSRSLDSIVAEAKNLTAAGVKEINLIAQDTTRYGKDLYGDFKLNELLSSLSEIEELAWLRVLYTYPSHFTDRLISEISKNDKVCNYLDIPLQHADDQILRAMNRHTSQAEIIKLIEKLRKNIPNLTLRTTFIVGFPGETELHFLNLINFIKEVKFDRLGVFAYSQEEGTPAADMPGQVPDEIKETRRDLLLQVQQEISLAKNREKIGTIVSALVEGNDENNPEMFVGRTEADAPDVDGSVFIKGNHLNPGDIVPVNITHAYEYDLIGEVQE